MAGTEPERRTTSRTGLARVPPAPMPPRALGEEILVVLALSLLASAVSAILTLFEGPISGVVVAVGNQSPMFARQVVGFVFGLAPVWLVVYLVGRDGERPTAIGLAWDRPRRDLLAGLVLFAIVGLVGLGVYLGAVALGVNRFVVPAPPLGHWWTVPALLMNAAEAALLEEVIVLGYLITRLQQMRWSAPAAVGASALLRGAYHVYQGIGGFAGNLVMGLFFGALFVRSRRTWPFVIAHFLLDVAAGVGYMLFREHLPGFR